MPQTQEEFYFALPYDLTDFCLYAVNHGISAEEVSAVVGLTEADSSNESTGTSMRSVGQPATFTSALPRRPGDRGRPMCGIAGSSPSAPPRRRLARRLLSMAAALAHRGPDEFGASTGMVAPDWHMPGFPSSTFERPAAPCGRWRYDLGRVQRRDLQLRRAARKTGLPGPPVPAPGSDTEVIVHAYRAWGDAAFERMNGQWAVAIWDSLAGRLVFSRDRVGICPLHFCEHRGRVYFASEVKAIFAGDPAFPGPSIPPVSTRPLRSGPWSPPRSIRRS